MRCGLIGYMYALLEKMLCGIGFTSGTDLCVYEVVTVGDRDKNRYVDERPLRPASIKSYNSD